jgi:hypothetical protein
VEIADSILGDIANVKGYDAFKQGFGYVASPLDSVMDLAKKLAGTTSPAETVHAVGLHTLSGFYSRSRQGLRAARMRARHRSSPATRRATPRPKRSRASRLIQPTTYSRSAS